MAEKTNEVRLAFLAALEQISSVDELEKLRVEYTGKKGYVTELLKEMKSLSNEEKKTFGQEVNVLKNEVNDAISAKREELERKQIELENSLMPEFDISMPADLKRGSYHPITLVQRQCEEIFKSMGFAVEDYSEIVTDYECFEALNIPKNHPARDMQDT